MRNFLYSLSLTLIVLQNSFAASYTREDFLSRQNTVQGAAGLIGLCREFCLNTDDFDLTRDVQDAWAKVDPQGVIGFFRERHNSDPESKEKYYLYARLIPSKPERILHGRALIKMDPNWRYGYRLLLYTYVVHLFYGKSEDVKAKLAKELRQDEHYFDTYDGLETDRQFADKVRYYYLTYKNRTEEAEKLLAKSKERGWDWATGKPASSLTGNLDRLMVLDPAIAGDSTSTEFCIKQAYYAERAREYGIAIKWYQRVRDLDFGEAIELHIGECMGHLAKNDSAFFYIDRYLKRAEAVLDRYESRDPYEFRATWLRHHLLSTLDFTPLHKDDRWRTVEMRTEKIEERKEKLIEAQKAPYLKDYDEGMQKWAADMGVEPEEREYFVKEIYPLAFRSGFVFKQRDEALETIAMLKNHPKATKYYFVWTVIAQIYKSIDDRENGLQAIATARSMYNELKAKGKIAPSQHFFFDKRTDEQIWAETQP